MMRSIGVRSFALAIALLTTAATVEAGGRVSVKRGPRGRVTKVSVRTGFPIRRDLPNVVVRPAPRVRVTPRVYLPAVVFSAAIVTTLPDADQRVWKESTEIDRQDGWTDFTLSVDRRGDRMFLQIERGAAQISFAEVVFDNGDAQVIDFADGVQKRGYYALADFRDGRRVDHVRVVAKAAGDETEITLHLTK